MANGIGEERQQREGSLCEHSRSSIKAEAFQVIPVKQQAKKDITIASDMFLNTLRRGGCHTMWEYRSLTRMQEFTGTGVLLVFSCLLINLVGNCNKPELTTLKQMGGPNVWPKASHLN